MNRTGRGTGLWISAADPAADPAWWRAGDELQKRLQKLRPSAPDEAGAASATHKLVACRGWAVEMGTGCRNAVEIVLSCRNAVEMQDEL